MCSIFFFFNDTATTEIYTFPYTTLFRSLGRQYRLRIRRGQEGVNLTRGFLLVTIKGKKQAKRVVEEWYRARAEAVLRRSEEHTSELQSRLHLVCRLLLEKKK